MKYGRASAVVAGLIGGIAICVSWSIWGDAAADRWADWRSGGHSIRLVAYGTSLTAVHDWTAALQAATEACGLRLRAWNEGKRGATSSWGLAAADERVVPHHPGVVLIEFAINDAVLSNGISLVQSASNIEALIDRLRNRIPGVRVLLLTMNPVWGEPSTERPNLAGYYAQYAEIAAERTVELVDLYPTWNRVVASDQGFFHVLVPDGLHPTFAAHLVITVPGVASALAGRVCTAP